ncbi:galactose mutarotase [Virgibacillus sp. MSP4-1]|uniref:aldose epimerase family protein n=1 Tax=Virgibacillus sp. MSP4-1 TaxID=2700081 RepID=UPI0003A4E2F6|nr:aldose epimerase family protein [Virgibacillus sp. MSP4-1]QHS21870.1 galactose mutarotase [Virgibacillus sp. MSP4-1]
MHVETQSLNNEWKLYKLVNDHGMEVHVLNFGGIITKILVPDKKGKLENVVLGYQGIEQYEHNSIFLGALIGPVAGRIKGASFQLKGHIYHLEANNGNHHLHGGSSGFHSLIWKAQPFESANESGVHLCHVREDGDGGYPGEVRAEVTYTLTNDNELILNYKAVTDQWTPIALTNHSYFNLSGNVKDTIHDHQVTIQSHRFVELDKELIPTGRILKVENTPFDFRKGRYLRAGIHSSHEQNLVAGNGYDHYFLFDESEPIKVVMKDPRSGRILSVKTDDPGMVMYTGNHLPEGLKLAEGTMKKYSGVCFETQSSPASLHEEGFPSALLKPEETYRRRTVFQFDTEK